MISSSNLFSRGPEVPASAGCADRRKKKDREREESFTKEREGERKANKLAMASNLKSMATCAMVSNLKLMASNLRASNLLAMVSNLLAMVSNLLAMASNQLAMASNQLAMVSNLLAMASNLITLSIEYWLQSIFSKPFWFSFKINIGELIFLILKSIVKTRKKNQNNQYTKTH